MAFWNDLKFMAYPMSYVLTIYNILNKRIRGPDSLLDSPYNYTLL